MSILQMLKREPGIAEHRAVMAAEFRRIRKQDRAKARLLFTRMRAASRVMETSLMDNLYLSSEPRFMRH